MIFIQPGLYLRVEELEGETAPLPSPLQSGFSSEVAYLALGAFSLSESGEAFLFSKTIATEIWFISNRHLRTHTLRPTSTEFRLPLQAAQKRTRLAGEDCFGDPMGGGRLGDISLYTFVIQSQLAQERDIGVPSRTPRHAAPMQKRVAPCARARRAAVRMSSTGRRASRSRPVA